MHKDIPYSVEQWTCSVRCVDETQLPPTRGYSRCCAPRLFHAAICKIRVRELLLPEKSFSAKTLNKKPGCSYSRRNASREKRTATSGTKLRSMDNDKHYVIVVNEGSQEEHRSVSLMSNDSAGIFASLCKFLHSNENRKMLEISPPL